jgi:hypothetical protein
MIYVLLLEQNKFYVGFSDRPIGERFNEHCHDQGSKWTTLYRPVQVLITQPGGIEEENEMTLRMMEKYGWWNVRGGCWCKVDMQFCPPALLERQGLKLPVPLRQNQPKSNPNIHSQNSCSRFGGDSPSVEDCNATTNVDVQAVDSDVCYRCGRNSHFVKDCYARTHIKGFYLR